jgi:hypothetical protein
MKIPVKYPYLWHAFSGAIDTLGRGLQISSLAYLLPSVCGIQNSRHRMCHAPCRQLTSPIRACERSIFPKITGRLQASADQKYDRASYLTERHGIVITKDSSLRISQLSYAFRFSEIARRQTRIIDSFPVVCVRLRPMSLRLNCYAIAQT